MKKFVPLLLMFLFSFSVYAQQLRVVCTTAEIADIVKNVGGDKVEAIWLMDGRQDPHSVEPRPSMVIKARDADAVAVIGMDLDMWMDGVIRASRNPKIQKGNQGYIDLSEKIDKLEVPEGKVDGSMGDVHVYGNPHYWLNPENGAVMAATISERLSVIDPDNTSFYTANMMTYNRLLEKKAGEWKKAMEVFKGVPVLPTHNCWLYFIEYFGMESTGYLESKPGIYPSPRELVALSEKMKAQGTKIIFAEPFYPSAAVEKLSEMTGAKVVRVPSSSRGAEGTETYIGLFDYVVKNLSESVK